MAIQDSFNSLKFSTIWPIDKIGQEGQVTYTKSSTGASVEEDVTNQLGYKCLPTIAWSVDAANFYPANAVVSPDNPYSVNVKVSATGITTLGQIRHLLLSTHWTRISEWLFIYHKQELP